MPQDVAQLAAFAAASKVLAYVPAEWAETPYKNSTRLDLLVSLLIDGVGPAGLALRCTAIKEQPDRDLTFQVEWQPPGRRRLLVERMDLWPLRPHGNKGFGPPELRFLDIAGSHLHSFDLNTDPDLGLRAFQGWDLNLPVAVPLEEPRGYQQALALCRDRLKIDNADRLPQPPWEYRLNL